MIYYRYPTHPRIEYTLTEQDLRLAEIVAKERTSTKNKGYEFFFGGFHRQDNHPAANERWYPHMLGLLGEITYARITGEVLDLSFRKGGDKGADFKDVEVKTRKSKDRNPYLLVRKNDTKRKKPKKYVLLRLEPDFTIVEVMGQVSYERFVEEAEELEFPGRTNLGMKAINLDPFIIDGGSQ